MTYDEARHLPYKARIKAAAECVTRAFGTMDDDSVGIVLGTGMHPCVQMLLGPDAPSLAYRDIRFFPTPRVKGHAGIMWRGKIGKRSVLILQGRSQACDGLSSQTLALPMYALHAAGVRTLFATSAVGAIDPQLQEGDLVVVSDHINFTGGNPLVGQQSHNNFLDMQNAYDTALRMQMLLAGTVHRIKLVQGVYAGMLGPVLETPAEIRMLKTLGADVVGMSLPLEIIAARHAGMRCAGLACVSNMAAGVVADTEITHTHNTQVVERHAADIAAVLQATILTLS